MYQIVIALAIFVYFLIFEKFNIPNATALAVAIGISFYAGTQTTASGPPGPPGPRGPRGDATLEHIPHALLQKSALDTINSNTKVSFTKIEHSGEFTINSPRSFSINEQGTYLVELKFSGLGYSSERDSLRVDLTLSNGTVVCSGNTASPTYSTFCVYEVTDPSLTISLSLFPTGGAVRVGDVELFILKI